MSKSPTPLPAHCTSRRAVLSLITGASLGLAARAVAPAAADPGQQGTAAALDALRNVTELQNRALDYTNRMEYGKAEQLWSELITMNEKNAPAWSNRGNCRTSMGHFREAVKDFDIAVHLAPAEPDPYLGRGVAFEGLGEYRKAIAEYEMANKKSMETYHVDDPVTWNNRGNAYAGLEDWDQAVTLYRKAADMAPRTYVFPRANEALALWQVGKRDESLVMMRFLVRKYPDFADMHGALAAAYWEQGEAGNAENEWLKTMQLDVRYRNIDWVRNDRRWPPALASSLGRFLRLA